MVEGMLALQVAAEGKYVSAPPSPIGSSPPPSSERANPRDVPSLVRFVSGWWRSVFLGSSMRALSRTEPLRISVSVHSSQIRSAGSPLESVAPVVHVAPYKDVYDRQVACSTTREQPSSDGRRNSKGNVKVNVPWSSEKMA